ncbi:MAG: HpcH/HpaI aldolase family protein [Arenicellales bacterium WSBS_2016_MAG_OTU3]
MKLATNTFKQAIQSAKPQVGLWVSLCSNFAADIVASAGYDWVLLDMEHAPNEVSVVMSQLQAFSASDTTPVVRPMWNDAVVVKRLLDIGSSGLLFPMVQSPEEAELAVRATRYPPNGVRGVSTLQRGNKFGRVTDYFERVEEETCVIVQVETRKALEQVAEIASVEGIDGVFFGPADIGADIGKLGQPGDPEIWELIAVAAAKVIAAGKPVGTLVADADKAGQLFQQGFTFVACGTDASLLARGADGLLADVRDRLAQG